MLNVLGDHEQVSASDITGSSRFVMIPLGDDKLPVARVAAAIDSIWARVYAEFR